MNNIYLFYMIKMFWIVKRDWVSDLETLIKRMRVVDIPSHNDRLIGTWLQFCTCVA